MSLSARLQLNATVTTEAKESCLPADAKGEIGPDLFRKGCEFGLEGLVSKHLERAYRPGPSTNWAKIKNRTHPAMKRGEEWNDKATPRR